MSDRRRREPGARARARADRCDGRVVAAPARYWPMAQTTSATLRGVAMTMMHAVDRRHRGCSFSHGAVALAAIVLLCMASAAPARAIYMTMEATKTDANTAKLCIGLDSGGQKVAGTQNDLIWDESCSKLKPNSCAAIPDSKKPLHGNTPANL